MLHPVRRAVAAASLALLVAAPARGQARLTTPDAALDEEFSSVRGIRELRDGRLLISDYTDQRVVLADLARKSVTLVVREGAGPREARLPTRLVTIPGDSTLLVDLGNNRLLLFDPDGRPVRTLPGERIGVLGLRGLDPQGNYLFAIPGWAERDNALPGDSVRVVRWNPRTDVAENVLVIQGDRMRSDIRSPARTPRIPTVGYAAQDAWVVTAGGVVRVVRAGGYRVEIHAPGAAAVLGPSYAYPTRAVSSAERTEYVRRFLTESPMSGKGPDGGMGQSPTPTDAEIAAVLPGTQFAERHPMFDAGRVVALADGRLWVGHPAEEGKPVLYDVFDARGKRTGTVELPAGRRVMAVGRLGVYAVAESELGVQKVERYALP